MVEPSQGAFLTVHCHRELVLHKPATSCMCCGNGQPDVLWHGQPDVLWHGQPDDGSLHTDLLELVLDYDCQGYFLEFLYKEDVE